MADDLRAFWSRIQSGVEVAVAAEAAPELLGTRDGFIRYLGRQQQRPLPVVVIPHDRNRETLGLAASDEATIRLAQDHARALKAELGDTYHFYVGVEGGVHALEIGDGIHYFIHCWSVIIGALGEAWGSSGSIEIPQRLVAGLDDRQVTLAVPGTRRRGGMIASLTGGGETRRTAIETSVFHALSSLFYGILERPPSATARG